MAENKMKKNSCHSERYATTARQLRSCVLESESKEMLKQVQHDNFVELGELKPENGKMETFANKKQGYAAYKRQELLKKLKSSFGKLVNISTGIEANFSKKSLDKMTSAKALEKSKANGFSLDEHFELAAKIKPLYESAILVTAHGNLKNPDDPNVLSIKRFISAAILKSGKKADVLITVKESIANGHKIYSIELDEINKASERFQGLSDAAASSGQGN